MSYRFMRMLVFFDLPTETGADRGSYRKFRKLLLDNGFVMMQESVYCKLLLNEAAEKAAADTIRKNKPPKGLVQLLTITEKQFAKIEYISGEFKTEVITTDERMVVI